MFFGSELHQANETAESKMVDWETTVYVYSIKFWHLTFADY